MFVENKLRDKIVRSGNQIEVYNYSWSPNFSMGAKLSANPNYRLNNSYTAKRQIRRLIQCNAYAYNEIPKFLTLTFRDNVQSVEFAQNCFRDFIRQLSYSVYKKQSALKWLATIEFQGRGAVHYHIVLFNLPYMDFRKLDAIWPFGTTTLKAVQDAEYLSKYVSKYITKNINDSRLADRHFYKTSRGLIKPSVVTDEAVVKHIQQNDLDKSMIKTDSRFTFGNQLGKYTVYSYPELPARLVHHLSDPPHKPINWKLLPKLIGSSI